MSRVVRVARWMRFVLGLAVGLALALPATASAHAVLTSTQPDSDAVVAESPRRVELRFNEAVEGALGAIRVYDGEGREVAGGKPLRTAPEQVAIAIEDTLQRGTYTVTWRAISADSDPIDGAFVFHVQEPGPQPAGVASQVLESESFGVAFLYAFGRGVDYLLLLLCVGGTASLLFVLRGTPEGPRRRVARILARAAIALAVVALIGLVLQAATAGDLSLTEAAKWDAVSQVIDTKYGRWSLIRAGLAVVLALLVMRLARERPVGERALAAAVAFGMILTPVASGHASVSGVIAFVSDTAHVQAAAIWTGGLAILILGLWLARQDRWELAARAVPRFSNMAVGAVLLLVCAGIVNGVIQLGAWDVGLFKVDGWRGLWDTTYGLLLLAKIALVIPLVALGAFNNRYSVPRLRAGIASVLERRLFLRRVSAEVTLMAVIIGVTAVLVNAAPAKDEVAMHGPVAEVVDFGEVEAHLAVEPAMAGRNDIHLEFRMHDGKPVEVQDVAVSARLASRGVGPLRFKAKPGGMHGAYVISGASIPIAGEWQFRVEARRGEFDAYAETVSVSIEEES